MTDKNNVNLVDLHIFCIIDLLISIRNVSFAVNFFVMGEIKQYF